MGPCHSSTKKKSPAAVDFQPKSQPQPQPQPEHPAPIEAQRSPLHTDPQHPIEEPLNPKVSTPLKEPKHEPNVGSSGLKPNNRYEDVDVERSNAISKQEPHGNQDVKMGSHFYYNQKEGERDSGKLAERQLEFEEHEFKEPNDFRTSLHSNQLNRREIFSEVNKNKFIGSKNIGDPDEPMEMAFDETMPVN